jgi:hypothetical protein
MQPVWAPNASPSLPPPPRPTPQRRWGRTAGGAAVLAAVVVTTAAITYTLARQTEQATVTEQPPTATAPQYSPAERAAAKDRICHIYDVSTAGSKGQGGLRVDGQLNIPVVLRTLGTVAAVQDALTPAVPPDVAAMAHKYISAKLDLTAAAMNDDTPIDDVNRLTIAANTQGHSMTAACGLS